MAVIGEALIEILPETEGFLSGVDSKIGGLLEKLHNPVGELGVSVLAVGAGLTALGEKFEDAFHGIERATGRTGEELEGLETSFKNVLAGTAGSFDQVQAAISGIADKTNLSGEALDDFATKEVDLARITKTDVGANVEATTTLFNKFGIAATEQSQKLDVLFRASQESGESVASLASDMASLEPVTKSLGLSFDQTAALMATFEKNGIPAAAATTGLRTAFKDLTKEGNPTAEGLEKMITTLANTKDPAKAAELALKDFGARAGPLLLQAVQSGKFNVDELVKSITDGKGGIIETTKETQTLGDAWQHFQNDILVKLEPIAIKAIGAFVSLFDRATELADSVFPKIERAWDDLTEGFADGKWVSAVGDWNDKLTQFGVVVRKVVDTGRSAWRDLVEGFRDGKWVSAVGDWNDKLTQFGVKAREVFDFARTQLEHFEAYWSKTFPKVQEATRHVMNAIRDVIQGDIEFIEFIWRHFGEQIATAAEAAWSQIENIVSTAVRVVRDVINFVLDLINGDWTKAWKDVQDIFSALWDFLLKTAQNALDLLGAAIVISLKTMVLLFENLGGKALERFVGALASGWVAANNFFISIPGRVIDAVGDLLGTLYNKGHDLLTGLSNGVSAGVGAARDFFVGLPSSILQWLGNLDTMLLDAGRRIIGGLASGITGAAGKVKDAVGGVAGSIRDHLPFSPAKEGPLAGSGDPLLAGGRIVERLASGLESQIPTLRDSMAKTVGGLGLGPSGSLGSLGSLGGSGGGHTINVHINAPGATQQTVSALRDVARTEIAGALKGVLRATTAGAGAA